jgi:hypothetical protein
VPRELDLVLGPNGPRLSTIKRISKVLVTKAVDASRLAGLSYFAFRTTFKIVASWIAFKVFCTGYVLNITNVICAPPSAVGKETWFSSLTVIDAMSK